MPFLQGLAGLEPLTRRMEVGGENEQPREDQRVGRWAVSKKEAVWGLKDMIPGFLCRAVQFTVHAEVTELRVLHCPARGQQVGGHTGA